MKTLMCLYQDMDANTAENKPKVDELTEEKLANVKEVFSLFDKDNDGAILTREVILVLRSVGYNPEERVVKELIAEYDQEGEGTIEFATFLELIGRIKREGETELEMDDAFRVFDPKNSGYISAVDLRQVLTNLGEKLSEEEADDLIAYADVAGSGEINYREFIKILLTDGDYHTTSGT